MHLTPFIGRLKIANGGAPLAIFRYRTTCLSLAQCRRKIAYFTQGRVATRFWLGVYAYFGHHFIANLLQ